MPDEGMATRPDGAKILRVGQCIDPNSTSLPAFATGWSNAKGSLRCYMDQRAGIGVFQHPQ